MEIIRQPQPRKAAGFVATRQFTRHLKVKRNRSEINEDQSLKDSPWDHIQSVSKRVDTNRANWRGILYMQQEYELYDPKPRLVKKEER